MKLIRYWFEFGLSLEDRHPSGVLLGCGVTAYSYEDAIALLKDRVFTDQPVPKITRIVENIDVSSLDENHVLPNIETPIYRGIWFPLGY